MASSPYDFVIVGGGTAGLVVASRLSEDSSQQVLVLEAGSDTSEDPHAKTPGLCMSLLGSDLDWSFSSEVQPHLNDRVIGLNQGKALGGSSATNFQAYTSPPFDESLAERLGIDGWTERSTTHGPVRTSFCGDPSHPIRKVWADTFRNIGHYMTQDPFYNASVGGFSSLSSVDPNTNERSHSATAYYHSIKSIKNLQVIPNAFVEKVLLDGQKQKDQVVKAVGVAYRQDGELKEVGCNKEVIIAAGALQTPKVLELSGIGDGGLLSQHGIDTIVDLPGVGENLHDHLMCSISFAAADDLETFDAVFRRELDALEEAKKRYAQDRSGSLASLGVYTYAYLPVLDHVSTEGRQRLMKLLEDNRPSPAQGNIPAHAQTQAYYQIAEADLLDPTQPSCAYMSFISQFVGSLKSNTKSFSISAMHSQPLSRGTVHIPIIGRGGQPDHRP